MQRKPEKKYVYGEDAVSERVCQNLLVCEISCRWYDLWRS